MAPRLRPNLGSPSGPATAEVVAGFAGAVVGATVGRALAFTAPPTPHSGWWSVGVVGAYAAFGACSALLVLWDLREHRLPNRLIGVAAVLLLGPLGMASVAVGAAEMLILPTITMLVCALACAALWWFGRGAFGGGDAKLLPIASFAALWAAQRDGSDAGWQRGALMFAVVLTAGIFFTGVFARLSSRRRCAAAPAIVAAAWMTIAFAQ